MRFRIVVADYYVISSNHFHMEAPICAPPLEDCSDGYVVTKCLDIPAVVLVSQESSKFVLENGTRDVMWLLTKNAIHLKHCSGSWRVRM
jgi:hypothetical protein